MSNTTLLRRDGPPATSGLRERLNAATADATQWLTDNWVQVGVALIVGTALFLALIALRSLACRASERLGRRFGFGSILGEAVRHTGTLFLFITAGRLVVGYADPPAWLYQTVRFAFTVAAVLQVAVWVRELVLGLVRRRADSDPGHEALASAFNIIRVLVGFVVYAIAAIVILDNLGVDVTGLVAGLGIGGIAIGLAAQGIFSDLFAALSIIFDRPFRVGDVVGYGTSSGTVEAIGLKSTRVRAVTGELLIISNAKLLDQEVQNITRRDHRRLKFAIGVIYQTPPEVCARLPTLLREVVEAAGATFVRAGFVGFGDSALDYEVEFDTAPDFQSMYDARHAVGVGVLTRLNAEGVEFAYPTQTTFTSDPDGRMILPYADPQAVKVEG